MATDAPAEPDSHADPASQVEPDSQVDATAALRRCQLRLEGSRRQLEGRLVEIQALQTHVAHLDDRITTQQDHIEHLNTIIAELQQQAEVLDRRASAAIEELDAIRATRSYRALLPARRAYGDARKIVAANPTAQRLIRSIRARRARPG